MPSVTNSNVITNTSQIVDRVITAADIAIDTITANEIAPNAVGDSEIAAHTTTKITVPFSRLNTTAEAQGDIMYRDATAWTRLAAGASGLFLKSQGAAANPIWAAGGIIAKTGNTSRAGDAASGTQNIAHGLNAVPKFVKIIALKFPGLATSRISFSIGTFDGTTQNAILFEDQDAATSTGGVSVGKIINIDDSGTGANAQTATITVDATNLILSWTKTGTPNANGISLLWEAYT